MSICRVPLLYIQRTVLQVSRWNITHAMFCIVTIFSQIDAARHLHTPLWKVLTLPHLLERAAAATCAVVCNPVTLNLRTSWVHGSIKLGRAGRRAPRPRTRVAVGDFGCAEGRCLGACLRGPPADRMEDDRRVEGPRPHSHCTRFDFHAPPPAGALGPARHTRCVCVRAADDEAPPVGLA